MSLTVFSSPPLIKVKGHTTLLINGISGAWGLVVTFIFIAFIGKRPRMQSVS